MFRILLIITCIVPLSCSSAPAAEKADASTDSAANDAGVHNDNGNDPDGLRAFDSDHVLKVEITINEKDWETLCNDGRQWSDVLVCEQGPRLFEYEHFKARVQIDTATYEDVDIRKKGFMGSLSLVRPSLKLRFDMHVPGQLFRGEKRLTLNNNRQDPALVRQCITYELFADAGLIAPRCSLAHVYVNGKDLGIYTNVESIKKPFLRQHFDDDEGNLYEGQIADFTPDLVDVFEVKTNKETNDRSDLNGIVQALEADDDEVAAALEGYMDMDYFLDYWIMESMTAHWDSYTGNSNNYYVYHDPDSDLFYFIPWGTDGALDPGGGHLSEDQPVSVLARGHIASRLYSIPGYRDVYFDRMRELLDAVWIEDEVLARLNHYEKLTSGYVSTDGLKRIRDIVLERRNNIISEIDSGGMEWTIEPRTDECIEASFEPVSGSFNTQWATIDYSPSDKNPGEIKFTYDGVIIPFEKTYATAGKPREYGSDSPPVIRLIGVTAKEEVYVIQLYIEEELFSPGAEIPFHGFADYGIVIQSPETLLGRVADGIIRLDQAGMDSMAPVSGSFEAMFIH